MQKSEIPRARSIPLSGSGQHLSFCVYARGKFSQYAFGACCNPTALFSRFSLCVLKNLSRLCFLGTFLQRELAENFSQSRKLLSSHFGEVSQHSYLESQSADYAEI
jgi:hypothetical protein